MDYTTDPTLYVRTWKIHWHRGDHWPLTIWSKSQWIHFCCSCQWTIPVPTKTQLSNFLGTPGEDYFKGNPEKFKLLFPGLFGGVRIRISDSGDRWFLVIKRLLLMDSPFKTRRTGHCVCQRFCDENVIFWGGSFLPTFRFFGDYIFNRKIEKSNILSMDYSDSGDRWIRDYFSPPNEGKDYTYNNNRYILPIGWLYVPGSKLPLFPYNRG